MIGKAVAAGKHGVLALVVSLLVCPGVSRASSVSVKAYLDQSEIEVGGQALLSIEVSGSTRAQVPALGTLQGLTASYLGPSTQISIIQGKVSRTITYRYRLVAQRQGEFTLGPFTVDVAGTSYRTEPLSLGVRSPSTGRPRASRSNGKSKRLFLQLAIPKTRVYLHERVPLDVTLYVGSVRVENIEYPVIAGTGFSQDSFGEPVRGQRLIDGRRYQTIRFHAMLVPERSGKVAIGPATMKIALLVRRRGWDDFFDSFWRFDPFAEQQPLELRSEAYELSVLPLPQVGRPVNFSGAVGQFEFSLQADPHEVRIGDPVTITVTISGQGNLAGIAPPEVKGDGFKSYPVQEVKQQREAGKSVFEQVVIPTSKEANKIPPLVFSYFDPEAGRYETLVSQPVALSLLPGLEASNSGGAGKRGLGREGEVIGQDIVYIKDLPGKLQPVGWRLYRSRWFWGLHAVPLVLFCAMLFLTRRKQRLLGDPRYARYLRAGREARQRLRLAARRMGQGDGALYDELGRTVRDYLSAKLDLAPGAVDPQRVVPYLRGDSTTATNLRDLFAIIEEARYGQKSGDPGTERKALDLARTVVKDLERDRRLRQRIVARRSMVLLAALAGLLATTALAAGLGAAKAAFFSGNELYRTGRYEEAVKSYLKVLDSGLESAPVHYNLGNAYFKLDRLGEAIASYERARRLSPRDPDIRANLQFARSRLKAAEPLVPVVPLWRRLVFPLAFTATARELILAASGLYFVLVGLLIARLLLPRFRHGLTRAGVVAALLLALVAGSALERTLQEDFRPRAVVVASEPVAVRFEPSRTGTVHFRAPEGMVLSVLHSKESWIKVKRPDGKRGWVEAGTVEVI